MVSITCIRLVLEQVRLRICLKHCVQAAMHRDYDRLAGNAATDGVKR